MEKNGVFLSNRQISAVLSVLILAIFFVFISGYFFGKKKAVDKLYNKIDKESLADQVYYSVCSNYGCDDIDQNQESTEDSNGESQESQEAQESQELQYQQGAQDKQSQDAENQVSLMVNGQKNTDRLAQNSTENCDIDAENTKNEDNSNQAYSSGEYEESQKEECYAELVGFGTKSAAQAFYNRLKKEGISVILKKRTSKNSRGRIMCWYQAVTEKFDNKRDLIAFVDIIKDKENLKGVKIIQI